MKNSEIVPLITDIKKLPIGYYLESSDYERLAVKQGFGKIWQQFYKYFEDKRKGRFSDYNSKPGDCKNALILIIERLYETEKDLLNKILYSTFLGYTDWNFNEIDLSEILEDLKLINFPKNWLKNIEDNYLAKNRMALDNKKIDSIGSKLDKEVLIKESEILKANKSEWIRLMSKAKTKEVITQLIDYTINSDLVSIKNELINQSSRFHRIQDKVREGIIDIDTENLEMNKINKAILGLIEKIK